MKIGIDIDGVIANTQPIIEHYAVKYNDEVVRRGLKLHKNRGVTYEMFDWTEAENNDFCLNHLEEAVVQADLRPAARETIAKLHDEGHTIAIISSRAQPVFKTPYETTEKWLRDKGIVYDELLVGTTDKKSQAIKYGLEAFIEDEEKYIRQLSEIIPVLVMDWPWNYGLEGPNLTRVFDWAGVYQALHELEKQKMA